LISNQAVLTAAHCIPYKGESHYQVELGVHWREKQEVHDIEIKPKKVIPHPGYNKTTVANDLAIIILPKPIKFTKHYSPVCMPKANVAYHDHMATVSGWGSVRQGGSLSPVLLDTQVKTMSNAQCKRTNYDSLAIQDNMICAEGYRTDSCQGDSGGPMTVKQNANYLLAGVVSWGYGCAQSGYPGVYARTEVQLDWIERILAANTDSAADDVTAKMCHK